MESKSKRKKREKAERKLAYRNGKSPFPPLNSLGFPKDSLANLKFGVKKTWKLVIEYDGTNFFGWQAQQDVRTVQDVIENAIFRLSGEQLRIQGASRTDRGVHAKGQVAVFQSSLEIKEMELVHQLNSRLPPDVSIRSCEEVHEEFDPRNSVQSKIYRYHLHHNGPRSPLLHRYSWYTGNSNLNLDIMEQVAQQFVGKEMDFTSFGTSSRGDEDTNRLCTIEDIVISQENAHSLFIDIKGKRFIYRMVRNIIGYLVEFGLGKQILHPNSVKDTIESKNRKQAGMGAPACGLTLFQMNY